MKYTFSSNLKQHIEGIIEQKNALGFPYIASERVLKNFDDFCLANFSEEQHLTKEIGQAWAVIRSGEKTSSFQNRIAPIRELAKYMNRLGFDAYFIPYDFTPRRKGRYVPHIFIDAELKQFFSATDRFGENERCRIRHIAVPVLFRLMYCCGLRPHEVRLIKKENIDLASGMLKIPESKGHKDRLVMISKDVLEICRKYYDKTKDEFPSSEYFFPAQLEHGNCYSANWVRKMFKICLATAGMTEFSGNKPRPYDFRHTFATKKMYEWMMEGKDLDAYLPYLSEYLGHTKFSHTAYYIHLVPEIFPHMAEMDFGQYEALIPEVDDSET